MFANDVLTVLPIPDLTPIIERAPSVVIPNNLDKSKFI